jgi:3-oxoacyl-[acyl-carrier-protein] synthase-1
MAVFVASHNMISSLGFTSRENLDHLFANESGIQLVEPSHLTQDKIPLSLVNRAQMESFIGANLNQITFYSDFDKLMILSAHQALKESKIDASSPETLFILSTTKGNVQLLEEGTTSNQLYLWHSAELLRNHFHNPNKGVVISNACISGVMAILAAKRLIDAGKYKHAVVVGVDILSRFVISGFQAFHSLSPEPCRPFDKNRDGLTLGEGAATMVLTNEKSLCPHPLIEVAGGATSNDANHISGPSRTGEGLFIAITQTLAQNQKIDFISAHGTATPYNDDMESIALSRSGLSYVPVNSMKGYFGHTLGAAGVLESVACIGCMLENQTIATKGFTEFGVAEPITIAQQANKLNISKILKMASGFGGSNAALLLEKHE